MGLEAIKLAWTRGGDGSHWDGCYASHWDCAIRELRKALGNLVAAIEGDWSEDSTDREFTRAIEIYDATEEKYDDRP